MYALTVTPVFDLSAGPNRLYHHRLPGFAESQNEKYLISRWYVQSSTKLLPLYVADNAAAEAFLGGTQQDALSSYSVIAAEGPTYLCIPEDNDVCRWSLPFTGTRPVAQVTGPAKMREYERVLPTVTGENMPEWLEIHRRW